MSSAMGFGFRCGFLGMLHMDIVQERLEREHNLSLIMSAPTVVYRCTTTKGTTETVRCAMLCCAGVALGCPSVPAPVSTEAHSRRGLRDPPLVFVLVAVLREQDFDGVER